MSMFDITFCYVKDFYYICRIIVKSIFEVL